MSLEINKVYHGFKVLSSEYVEEISSQAYMFTHEKSGARLLYIANEDTNKVFSVAFRTPSRDSTGVAHILEHSVLCGSRKFPLKEPFVELVKGSMNTFLNAMTFSDKTMYPVASMNDKDFRNLMDVYLDAVFYPKIYDNKYLLSQEGWHYSLNDKDELIYKGVVYNEMKGVYSDPDAILEQNMMEALFPDTSYRFESGGHPECIPDLTQQGFEDFHASYYHPSNSYLYLYGAMDIEEQLRFIDAEYLSAFDAISVDSEIKLQPYPLKTVVRKAQYPLTEGEGTDNKAYLNLSFVVGEPQDLETYIVLSILDSVLVNRPGAPLKQALLDAGVAQDVYSSLTTSIRQNIFSITASGSNADQEELFVDVVYKTLNDLVHEGLDKDLLESALNIMEFRMREGDFGAYPKGLIYGIRAMDTWLYDFSPLIALRYNEALANVRTKIGGRYIESFIENYILDNTHRALVVLEAKEGLELEKNTVLTEKLSQIKANFTAEQMQVVQKDMRVLQEMQEHIDSPEVLESIPLLKLEDIKREVLPDDYQVEEQGGVQYLYQPANTNKIVYLEGRLEAAHIPAELTSYYYLLGEVLKQFNTDKYSYFELAKQIALHTGGVSFGNSVYTSEQNLDQFNSKLSFSAKCLINKIPETLSLVQEVLLHTDFGDKKRLQEVINEIKTSLENGTATAGHSLAVSRLGAYFSKAQAFANAGQLDYLYFINDLSENFASKADEIVANLQKVAKYVATQKGLFVGICCEQAEYPKVLGAVQQFVQDLPATEFVVPERKVALLEGNEGIYTSGMVQYVAMGGNYKELGFEYHGSLRVVETLLKYEYLWTNIRVKGGAYGMMLYWQRNGLFQIVSYRDPNLANTIKVYQGMGAYLRNLELSEREVLKYIIGTVSKMDTPLYNSAKLLRSMLYHTLNISMEDRQQIRNEVLDTNLQNIRAAGEMLEAVINKNYLCVVGSEKAVKENAGLFRQVFAANVGPKGK